MYEVHQRLSTSGNLHHGQQAQRHALHRRDREFPAPHLRTPRGAPARLHQEIQLHCLAEILVAQSKGGRDYIQQIVIGTAKNLFCLICRNVISVENLRRESLPRAGVGGECVEYHLFDWNPNCEIGSSAILENQAETVARKGPRALFDSATIAHNGSLSRPPTE